MAGAEVHKLSRKAPVYEKDQCNRQLFLDICVSA